MTAADMAEPFETETKKSGSLALMGFVGWQFARAALVNVPAVVLALVSLALVFRYKVNSAWLVLGGAVAGILFHTLGKV